MHWWTKKTLRVVRVSYDAPQVINHHLDFSLWMYLMLNVMKASQLLRNVG